MWALMTYKQMLSTADVSFEDSLLVLSTTNGSKGDTTDNAISAVQSKKAACAFIKCSTYFHETYKFTFKPLPC